MNKYSRYHLIGIAGSGMSAIARILHSQGHTVQGSDRTKNETAVKLQEEGIGVCIGHCAENVGNADCVVYSAAVSQDNPELVLAREKGIEIIERSEMLGRLMREYPVRIAVTGTHGKTTTTSMLDYILHCADLKPTSLIGADIAQLGGNARCGSDRVFLTEACEAFRSFLHLDPSIAVITNVDADHLDYYGDFEHVEIAFKEFVEKIDPKGVLIFCSDDPGAARIASGVPRKTISYGIENSPQYKAEIIAIENLRSSYNLVVDGMVCGEIQLNVPGQHNILNSLAAVAVARYLGVEFFQIQSALSDFSGASRRFDVIYNKEIVVVDDYAHHPAEIKALLLGAKSAHDKHTLAVFQPHLYSRTKLLLDGFVDALSIADEVIVMSAYAAREVPENGVNGDAIVDGLQAVGFANAQYVENKEDVVDTVRSKLNPNTLVLFIGAGDIDTVSKKLVESLV